MSCHISYHKKVYKYLYCIRYNTNMTISCRLMGGLGNQLFQIFATISYTIDQNTADDTPTNNIQSVIFPFSNTLGNRRTYWANFLNHITIITTANPMYGLSNSDIQRFPIIQEAQEMKYTPLPNIPVGQSNTCLYGYFQSPGYFAKHKEQIFEMIHLNEQRQKIRETYAKYYVGQSPATPVVSMHFRLGDYKNNPAHNILDSDYYRRALEQINLYLNAPVKIRVLYFCEQEDGETVDQMIQTQFRDFRNIEFVKVDDEIEDWKQMLLMSLCDSHIIANSTFSWWGAYMNPCLTKTVTYPRQWFGPNLAHIDMEASDLFPVDWIKI